MACDDATICVRGYGNKYKGMRNDSGEQGLGGVDWMLTVRGERRRGVTRVVTIRNEWIMGLVSLRLCQTNKTTAFSLRGCRSGLEPAG